MGKSTFIILLKKANAWGSAKAVIPFLVLIIIFSSCGRNNTDLFVTPHNYRGKVTVIFDHPEGLPEKFTAKERVFDIGTSGVLRTKGKRKRDFLYNPEFYYRTADSQLHKMADIDMLSRNPGLAALPGMKFDSLVIKELRSEIIVPKGGTDSAEVISYIVSRRD